MKQNSESSKYSKVDNIGSILLLAAAVLGFILSNCPLEIYYDAFVQFPLRFSINNFNFTKPLVFWINDGLVSLFFLLIGLEVKTMLFADNITIKKAITAPMCAAIAGVVFPALVFTIFNYSHHTNMRGWAIPTAMDTAFILGILALMSKRISPSLKFFVLTLSIIDDIIAILVIAIFYAEDLSNLAIIGTISVVGILMVLNQAGVRKLSVYLFFGFLLWLLVLGSGVHTSIAGVILAATIPMNKEDPSKCLVYSIRNFLHPIVAFFILPIFAFANTGFNLEELSFSKLFDPLALGIILGLFIGKQVGIFGVIRVLVKSKVISLPYNTTWWQMYGVSIICGVGYTMSLFIGILAFENGGPEYDAIIKSAVLIGSLLSAIFGFIVLSVKK